MGVGEEAVDKMTYRLPAAVREEARAVSLMNLRIPKLPQVTSQKHGDNMGTAAGGGKGHAHSSGGLVQGSAGGAGAGWPPQPAQTLSNQSLPR